MKSFQVAVGGAILAVTSYGVYLKVEDSSVALASQESSESNAEQKQADLSSKKIVYVLNDSNGNKICGSGDDKGNIKQLGQQDVCPEGKIYNTKPSLWVKVSGDIAKIKQNGFYDWASDVWTFDFISYLWSSKVQNNKNKDLIKECRTIVVNNNGKNFVEWYCHK
ncbi:hypothetical protein [Mycoplasma parvum]|uniref:Uncharacterized protein n=1 Tax=Mycoplasma parvum str. Indiana TaxID=1403316 RepID=U5NC83_9MOLU|nr:hypothetical protein [Mycoplasma parvum]AGX88910.1 hypothetical protein PRV_00720 [Mycoplasma parvum str. Indiana]